MKYVKGFDTLRSFAVFFVFVQHLGVWYKSESFGGNLVHNVLIPDGGFGVHLFFVLSGFLITKILLNDIQQQPERRLAIVKNFFIKRTLRIFPVYFALIFLLYLLNVGGARQDIWYCITYTYNFKVFFEHSWPPLVHLWSLGVEEQFYLLWPWVIVFTPKRYLKYALVSFIAIGWVSLVQSSLAGDFAPVLVHQNIDLFGVGAIYAYVTNQGALKQKFDKYLRYFAFAGAIAYFYFRYQLNFNNINTFPLFRRLADEFVTLGLIAYVYNANSSLFTKHVIENKWLMRLGRVSYGFYLFHMPYGLIFYKPINDFISQITATAPSVQAVLFLPSVNYWIHFFMVVTWASLSFNYLEQPILRLKERWV